MASADVPGICALIDQTHSAAVAAVLEEMLLRAKHHPWYTVEHHADPAAGAGLGRVSLGWVNADPQPVSAGDGSALAVLDGELFDYHQQRRALERAGRRFRGGSHAEILLLGYLCHGREFLARLNGKFSAAIWHAARRRLVLTNDRFGMKPLYYARLPNKLLAASEIKSILVGGDVPRTPDLDGISTFFSYGQYLGQRTSLEAVRVLPAAGWLVFDAAADRLSVDRYWRPNAAAKVAPGDAELLDRLDEAFKRAVDRQTLDTPRLGLALSGGLDSRSILAVIDHDRVPVTSVAMGIEGCRDHRSATQLAAVTRHRHHNYVLGADFLAEFEQHLRHMVRLTDGQYLSQCIVMPTLPYYRELGIDVLLRGHAGELMHMTKAYNFSLDRRALQLRDEAALEDWAFRHLRAYMLQAVDGPLLAARHGGDLDERARQSLRQCLREFAGIEPPVQRMWHLFLTQRLRRETALSLVKFGSLVETRIPYLDNELVDLLMAAPPQWKLGETIQTHILRRRRPEFLNVINANTGTHIGAGRIVRNLATLRQKVLAKVRVRGYQPYERLTLWLRRELKPLVERTLLSETCLDRGILNPDTVANVVRQHSRRRRNHTFLLMAMMIFELGHREFIDPPNPPTHNRLQ